MARTFSFPSRGGATLGLDETVQPGDLCPLGGATLYISGLGPAPRVPPREETPCSLPAGRDVAAAEWGTVDSVLHAVGSAALFIKHRILTSQHLGCTGLFYSLFSGKRESSSVLPIFLAGIVTVDRGMTKARGAAQRRWPRKPLRSFPVNASWRGRAGSREQGRPQFPLSATLTLQLSQSSGRSPGLYSLGRS